jgi:ketosteroid isomerase-like protein
VTVDPEGTIQSSYRAFRENDPDALVALYHPDAVWDLTAYGAWPEDPVYRGRDGIRAMLDFMWEVNEKYDNQVLEIVPAGPERYFVRGEITLTGAGSGIEMRSPEFGQLITFRDGLILRVEQYYLAEDARRAAGL